MIYQPSPRGSMAREDGSPLRPGDMFYQPRLVEKFPHWLSPKYWRHHAHRPPVSVILPNRVWFLVDGLEYHILGVGYEGEGFDVSGEPPAITIARPISESGWTGRLTGGVLEWEQ
jgi:hypothetical protein